MKIRISVFSILSSLFIGLASACTPKSIPTPISPTLTLPAPEAINSPTEPPTQFPTFTPSPLPPTEIPATNTPRPNSWPVYSLATDLPDSPGELFLYTQAYPAGLPDEARLAEILTQLQITGTVTTGTGEAGDQFISINGDAGKLSLTSVDPYIFELQNKQITPGSDPATTVLPVEERVQAAEAFLSARGLLDFPYLIEPPRLSRDRDRAVRVVPLLDGYPIYEIDPLNGRLLVWFNSAGEVSVVFWRPILAIQGEMVEIVPVTEAWEQLVSGKVLKSDSPDQCWQASVFDPNDPFGVAGTTMPASCYSTNLVPSFEAATITEVKLVYEAGDLYLGMSPFAFPADSPARVIYPMWEFYGATSDGREVSILWPAMQKP